MSLSVLFSQTAIVFLMIGIGAVARKCGVITQEGSGTLSELLMKITLPLNILASANVEAGAEMLLRLLQCLGLLLGCYLVCIAVCGALARALHLQPGARAVFITTSVFPNSAFIGIPFCVALFGDIGNLYGSAGVLAYNLLFFTYAVTLFRPGEPFRIKTLLTPVNLATLASVAMLVLGLRLPGVLQTVCAGVGGVTTPLALMIVGAMVAESSLAEVFRQKLLYGITLLRCAVFPLGLLLVMAALHIDSVTAGCTLVLASTASGSLTAVLARQTGTEPRLAGQAVVHSTLFLAVTLPPLLMLAQLLL